MYVFTVIGKSKKFLFYFLVGLGFCNVYNYSTYVRTNNIYFNNPYIVYMTCIRV